MDSMYFTKKACRILSRWLFWCRMWFYYYKDVDQVSLNTILNNFK